MKTTITEEFEDGQLVRRTTVTEGEPPTGGYVGPFTGGGFPSARCTCGPWSSVMPPPPCPVHGQTVMPTITGNASTKKTPKEIADEIGRQLRSLA